MTRLLDEDEIEYILDFIHPSQYIPIQIGEKVCENNKSKLIKQLKTIKIYPHLIDELKDEIQSHYEKSIIQAGESVGVICAQSIGEKNTQSTLNTLIVG
tara:strand:- start:70 stop:366 length:297 start_codon:yes stop_codon:yes gene_type:complete